MMGMTTELEVVEVEEEEADGTAAREVTEETGSGTTQTATQNQRSWSTQRDGGLGSNGPKERRQ
jgi:hypothetical protein